MEVEILHSRTGKSLATLSNVPSSTTVEELKNRFQAASSNPLERIAFKAEPKGKLLKDNAVLDTLQTSTLYFKDLGPQVGWVTVFLAEYSGPLFIFPLFYARPALIYGDAAATPRAPVVTTALLCWTFHYLKRDLETLFIHRFSHGTMPIRNIFKNCSYYWGFAAWIAYMINHPLYTPPVSPLQVRIGLAGFCLCELGNFFIHKSLRDLRPAGTRVRKIPLATGNPFTWLFNCVSCPNYTYEILSWVFFTIMTQSAVAGLFTFAGFYQMTVWALGKHRNYIKEFHPSYPRGRKAILPFLL